MAQKPSIPKGTRDFGPEEMNRRNYIFDQIRDVFRLFAFRPIETPALENLSTLLGKYGEEGDRLLFKILNSGDFLEKTTEHSDYKKMTTQISEKGLRYDLTVPFARYVVQHQNEITFPFKRYQMQPVWRADRPQKGRYREFYQCDADVIGSKSLLNEAELVKMIDEVFQRLNIRVIVKINNRKILAGIAEYIGAPDKIIDITVAIDKLDKIGLEKVNAELFEKGIEAASIERLQPVLQMQGSSEEKMNFLKNLLASSETGLKGIEEIQTLWNYIASYTLKAEVELDLTLARGLNYYTGAIFEVKALDAQIGSISGGGRYDDLTGIFGLPNMSGVGISFGADRIYDVMEELKLFPEASLAATRVLFVNFGDKETAYCLPIIENLRKQNMAVEMYPDSAKLQKQFSYANARQIPFVAIAGEREMNEGKIVLKNMQSGEEKLIAKDQIQENLH